MTFTQVLNLSISASWLVLAIAAARLVLRRAPKALHCALWALVAVRLLCPVSLESSLSLVPSREVIPESYLAMEPADEEFSAPARLEIVTNPVYDSPVTIDTAATVDRVQHMDVYASLLWLGGMGAMAVYAAYSYLSIRLRVRFAGWRSGRVWECDEIDSPFILGLLRPRIYLPGGLDEGTRAHVLAHETAHLKRLDHIWKPLGFALLTVHWFNPVMWLAYILLCRDIELACDEKVIRGLDKPQVRAYSEALVRCSVDHKMIAACPLAFGEVGVKGRIRSMLNYKKPGFWIIVIAILVSIAVAVCFLTDPARKPDTIDDIRLEDGCTIVSQEPERVTIEIYKDFLPENILNGKLHTFEPDEQPLYRTGDTTIYLESARTYGTELMLTLSFRHEIAEQGQVLLPYRVKNGGREWTAAPTEGSIARVLQYGPHLSVSLGVELDEFQNGGEYLSFTLEGLNLLTYRGDHLPPMSDAPPQLEAIIEGYGPYSMTQCVPEELGFMFYTHWLPEGFETGYDFSDGELVVMETETTTLQMTHAELEGEYYRFDFAFSYTLPDSGTIIVPYTVDIKGVHHTLSLDRNDIHDYSANYGSDVELEHEAGTHSFSLYVRKDLYEDLDDYLWVSLEGACALTYVEETMELSFENYHLVRDRYEVGEYERFVITGGLHLIGCEPEVLFPIDRDLGQLRLADPETAPVSEQLKRDCRWAWRCENGGQVNWLLQQTDGTLYVLTLNEDGTAVREQYRLEPTDESRDPLDPSRSGRRYTLNVSGTFDLPMFTLFSDGSFTFHISSLSSYFADGSYRLTDEELILKTDDGLYTWCFVLTDTGFAFDAARSSPIAYFRTAKELTEVQSGELFLAPGQSVYEPPELEEGLDEAISAAVLRANGADSLRGSLCAESHKILAELAVCGVATADGGAPMEELVVYLYAMFRERSTDGDMLYIEDDRMFPAVMTFTMTDEGYVPVEYRELTEEEARETFPSFGYQDLKENRDLYNTELSEACHEQLEGQLEALRADMAEAGRLIDAIAASPAQSSNPGAYIDAHPMQWDQLLKLDAAAVHYSFSRLSSGEETGLKGYLMALACQEIIASWGETCTPESFVSATDWFRQVKSQAKQNAADKLDWDTFRRTHPACTTAIVYTDYQDFPPP